PTYLLLTGGRDWLTGLMLAALLAASALDLFTVSQAARARETSLIVGHALATVAFVACAWLATYQHWGMRAVAAATTTATFVQVGIGVLGARIAARKPLPPPIRFEPSARIPSTRAAIL